jgi:hypothetical protein
LFQSQKCDVADRVMLLADMKVLQRITDSLRDWLDEWKAKEPEAEAPMMWDGEPITASICSSRATLGRAWWRRSPACHVASGSVPQPAARNRAWAASSSRRARRNLLVRGALYSQRGRGAKRTFPFVSLTSFLL